MSQNQITDGEAIHEILLDLNVEDTISIQTEDKNEFEVKITETNDTVVGLEVLGEDTSSSNEISIYTSKTGIGKDIYAVIEESEIALESISV